MGFGVTLTPKPAALTLPLQGWAVAGAHEHLTFVTEALLNSLTFRFSHLFFQRPLPSPLLAPGNL